MLIVFVGTNHATLDILESLVISALLMITGEQVAY